jgi:hypothetical protein
MVGLATIAIMVGGCADSRLAASNAASSPAGAQASSETNDYKTGYGLSSNGPTTDLYTELFRSSKRDDKSAPAPVAGTVQQNQPPSVSATVQQNQPAFVSATAQPDQPAPAPGVIRQEAAAAEATPSTATVYGMSSDGPTTDLYTALFGPRRRE